MQVQIIIGVLTQGLTKRPRGREAIFLEMYTEHGATTIVLDGDTAEETYFRLRNYRDGKLFAMCDFFIDESRRIRSHYATTTAFVEMPALEERIRKRMAEEVMPQEFQPTG